MKYRRLGSTNLKVSVVGVGTWQFGGEWGKEFTQPEVDRIFDAARQVGINLIDTAECYGDHSSEAFIGNAIAHDREKWVVCTKFGHVFHGHMNRTDERSASDAAKQLEASLKALKTDYVDLLQYHSVRDSEFADEALQQTLIKLKQQGKIRHIGNSIGNAGSFAQAEGSAKAQVEVHQVIYNRLDRRPEERIFPHCIQHDIGVLARVPLASGFLSGKYKPGATFGADDVRGGRDQAQTDEKLREVEKIAREEVPAGTNMAEWALAWCLKNPAVTSVIPGCKDVQQVLTNARAAELATNDHRLALNS